MDPLQQRLDATRSRLAQYGQEHLLRFAGRLGEDELQRLIDQIDTFDLDLIRELSEQLVFNDVVVHLTNLTAPDVVALPQTPAGYDARARARRIGEDIIRSGRLAALVVAGGQGTRLGFDGPKGCFPAGPVSGKSLFQLHAEKIRAAIRRYGAAIPWYIMTCEDNRAATEAFFVEHSYFGFDPGDVFFFVQGAMPPVDRRGRMLLETPGRVFTSPNGHGGTFQALADSGALDDMAQRGIEHIAYFQVDNVLIDIIDPVFTGYHVEAGSEMSSKGCRKSDPFERVGNFAMRDGRLHVVEYSDLPDAFAAQRAPSGQLLFGMGSIGIHTIGRAFAERIAADSRSLPYHRADKQVPHLDAEGRLVEPASKNAVKFEMFVFDALPQARNPIVVEVDRDEEFSPIKNSHGADSPETARHDMTRQALRWLDDAGVRLPPEARRDDFTIEIGPLFAQNAEELAAKTDRIAEIRDKLLLDEEAS